jgi:hypothetical protein
MNRRSKLVAGLGSLAVVGATALTGLAGAPANADQGYFSGTHLHAHLDPLNNSGVSGDADVRFHYRKANVDIDAYGLVKGMPHAQHIHYGEQARNECPTAADDSNRDFRLNTAEGIPAYGPIRKSLTLSGDTSPASGLAVARFPMAPQGEVHYNRTHYFGNDALRQAIRSGEGVLVIHGVDYNNNGKYDFAGAGKSELDPTLPAEATDPAVCGVLRVKHTH